MNWLWLLGPAVAVGGLLLLRARKEGALARWEKRNAARLKAEILQAPSQLLEAEEPREALDLAYDHVFAKWELVGIDALTEPERIFFRVLTLQTVVNGGGFASYLDHSYGDEAHRAVSDLQAVGANQAAAVVRETIALFGADGPSPDLHVREKQMDLWTDRERDELERLSGEFFDIEGEICDCVVPYVRENAAEFRQPPPSST